MKELLFPLLRPLTFGLAAFTLSLGLAMPAQARPAAVAEDSCGVVIPREYEEAMRANARRRVASHFSTPSKESVIKNRGKIYTFRLAACILPEYIRSSEGYGNISSDPDQVVEAVNKWWEELEQGLNAYYTNAVGVRFEVVRNNKLILFDYNVNGLQLDRNNITDQTRLFLSKQIIDKALGADSLKYDLGILIGRPNKSRNGVAQLGSAAYATLKGSAWAVNNITTIAHELGHSFGAEHTHLYFDAICTEPGSGRSIMSYGAPRDFFSLPSIYQMRNTLYNMNYYSDAARTRIVRVNPSETVTPYAEEAQGAQPMLDRQRIKTEYTITKGSDFQFYLPTTTKGDGAAYYYNVNAFDISKQDMANANTLRPSYKETKDSCIVFRSHCIDPSTITNTTNYLEPNSDYSATGTYTFMAAVHDHSRYDAMRIKVNVVDGDPFQINGVQLASTTMNNYGLGREVKISWNPCTQIYGEDSKVRILFSDDYGKTFRYVLADNVLNDGYHEFILPYFSIGKVNYENWHNFSTGGGRFKLEVVGEAACGIFPKQDYIYQSGQAIGSGYDFTPSQQRAMFRTTDNSPLPAPYVEVGSMDELPEKVNTLVAYSTRQADVSKECQCVETVEGSLVRRSWKANINNLDYTYTQLVRLPETVSESGLARASAQQLSYMARPLYANLGAIGYPYDWLPEAGEFKSAYERVYDGTDIRRDITTADVDNLNERMTLLSQIGDDKVAKPQDGKYYRIRSYLSPYNRDTYYYMMDDNVRGQHLVKKESDALLTDAERQNARWRCYVKDGKYHFVSDQGRELFSPERPEGAEYSNMTSEFRNFSNMGMERTLQRGYTWGALTIINSQGFGCMVGLNGYYSVVRAAGTNLAMTPDQRCNSNDGLTVSTDFQFVPTNEEDYTAQTDSIIIALGSADTYKFADNGRTWYVKQAGGEGVNIVYAKGAFTPGDNGRVSLTLPEKVTVNGRQQTVVGIVSREVNTGARLDNKFTYGLGTALGDFDFDLVIPATVRTIGDKALAHCVRLHDVVLGGGSQLATIGAEAFKGSGNMRLSRTLLDAPLLTSIGTEAFSGTALRRLSLNCRQNAIQSGSFAGAKQLEYLDLRSAGGSADVTRSQAGLSAHTLVFTNDGNEKTGEDETNVVRFSGSKGTCKRLALYDLTKDSQGGYTLYGISVPVADNNTEVAFTATEATFNRTFNKGYSTLCLPYAAALPEGMRAYRFVGRTVRDGDYTYSFTSAPSLEAHVPYLIHCERAGLKIGDASHVEVKAATRYTIGDAIASPATGDGFVGTLSAVSHDDALGHNIYTLNATRQQWLRITDRDGVINANAFVAPFRACFVDAAAAGARSIGFSLENSTTDIETLPSESRVQTGIYTIDGRKTSGDVSRLPKGLYIINGRKVVIK